VAEFRPITHPRSGPSGPRRAQKAAGIKLGRQIRKIEFLKQPEKKRLNKIFTFNEVLRKPKRETWKIQSF
jgi:hypothetical protein